MFCSKCGKDNPSGAQFCAFCGQPLVTNVDLPKKDEEAWEYCQIQAYWKWLIKWSKVECYFWADAIGKNGPYCAAKTASYTLTQYWVWQPQLVPPLAGKGSEEARSLLDELVKTLIKDGWMQLKSRGHLYGLINLSEE